MIVGDVRNGDLLDQVISDLQPDFVVHFAAETGTSQSMSECSRHASVNVVGTAELVDALKRSNVRPLSILLASSRAVYGEGAWRSADGVSFYPGIRSRSQFLEMRWDFKSRDGRFAFPLAHFAPEVHPHPTSVYGATKLAQEHILEAWCAANDISLCILRFQNVYGIGQSPSNPYTGIINIFHHIARKAETIPLYEDGLITRDFVWIDDVVDCCIRALNQKIPGINTYDVGSGKSVTIAEVASVVADFHKAPAPVVTGQFREGDVRFATANISKTTADLGYVPKTSLQEGVFMVGEWLFSENPSSADL